MRYAKLIISILAFLFIDLITKYFFYDNWFLFNSKFIDPILNFGISRSIPIPIFLTILISIIWIILFIFVYQRKYAWRLIVGLLVAWTLGNLIDRICLGWVRDFINIQIRNFPIFNFADVFLNVWIIIFILKEIFFLKKQNKRIHSD